MSVKHLVIGTPAPYYKTKLFYVFKYKVSFRACLCSTHQVFVYIKHLENCLYQNVKNNQYKNKSCNSNIEKFNLIHNNKNLIKE